MRRSVYYRVPLLLSGLAALALALEKDQSPEDAARAQVAATEMLIERYPESPQYAYARALIALQKQDYLLAREHFEAAVATKQFTNEGLLHTRARLLVYLSAPTADVDEAVALWKYHFPHSKNPDPRAYPARSW